MLGNHRELLDRLLISDSERIAPYVNLPAVAAVYDRMLRQPERATLPDVQHVWRAVSLSLWLQQVQGSPA